MDDTAAAIKGKRILVTGGAGFIGSTLIERLIDANKIVVLDTFDRDALSDKPYATHPNLEIARASVLDIAAVHEAARGAQLVIHCAGIAGIDTVIKRPTLTMLPRRRRVFANGSYVSRLARSSVNTPLARAKTIVPSSARWARRAGPTPSANWPKSIWRSPITAR